MPSNCSAPGCRSNYDQDEHIPVFKLTQTPDQLRHAWLRVLHKDDIDKLKVVYVCVKHFRDEDVEYFHRVPNGYGSFREIPRSKLKLKEGKVLSSILPGCPSYYSSHSATKPSRLSRDSKDDELFNQALTLSLRSENEEIERFVVKSYLDLQDKLPSLSIPKTWSLWYPDERTLSFMRPNLENCKILVDVYLLVEFD